MHRLLILPVCAAFALASCGPADQPAGQVAERRGETTGYVGPVSFRYDPLLLTPADVTIAIPLRAGADAAAIKLVPAEAIRLADDPCDAANETCLADTLPGVTLALLERPYDHYADALREEKPEGALAPVEIGGAQGVAFGGESDDGRAIEYLLVPVKNRALLIGLQENGETAREQAALRDVIASIALSN